MKKRTGMFMVLLFLLLLPFSVSAADQETYSSGHFYYHAYPGYVSISGYLGTETEVEIPSSLAGKPVSEIEDHAFDGCDSVKQITIPDTVTKIGVDAFKGAEALEKIISNTKDVSIVAEEKVTIETDYAADGSDEIPSAVGVTSQSSEKEQTGVGDGGYEEDGSEENERTEKRMQTEGMSQTEESVQTQESIRTEESVQAKESIRMEESVPAEQGIQTEKAVQTEQDMKEQKSGNQKSEPETDHAAGWILAVISVAAVCTGGILYLRKRNIDHIE